MNLMMLLEMAVSGFGDRVAVRSGAEELKYQQLFDAASAAAAEFEASGCENAALLDGNSLAVPVGLFASAWAGRPFVPLNYRLADAEIEALAERIAPSFLVTSPERADALAKLPRTTVVTREAFLLRVFGMPAVWVYSLRLPVPIIGRLPVALQIVISSTPSGRGNRSGRGAPSGPARAAA